MEITPVYDTANLTKSELFRRGQNHARICYTKEDWPTLLDEEYSPGLVEGRLLKGGHQSPFGHDRLQFYISGIPKAGAMLLNNQAVYNTSEKSARYTVMTDISPAQKGIYDKWLDIFKDEIDSIYPDRFKDRDARIAKMAQENARYVTSVFTPTKMSYSIEFRELNVLLDRFNQFIGSNVDGEFNNKLAQFATDFISSPAFEEFAVPELKDKYPRNADMHFFGDSVEDHFGDTYSTNLDVSFAALAQLQRHRTISHRVVAGYRLGAPNGFFVPPVIEGNADLTNEWLGDLSDIAETDFPQAQLITISERGNREDLQLKSFERICGLAQLETARAVKKVIDRFGHVDPGAKKWGEPECLDDVCHKGGCVFGGNNATERLL
ncbi:hypothetical protein HN747_02885 [archaeon]|nr:hypothetical protein [archaeon]